MKSRISCRFVGLVSGVFLLFGLGFVSGVSAEDPRAPVVLNETEHDFVLTEMRGFVESLQSVLSALADGDMETVAEAAKRSGMATAHKAPGTLGAKFPPAFAALGGNTHHRWDLVAAEAEDMGDRDEVIALVGELMNNCVACHANFRLVRE